LITTIAPQSDDEVIFLGDYIDRGPDSRDVVEQIIALQQVCNVVPLRGNHEIMLLGVLLSGLDPNIWLHGGGVATLNSYGGDLDKVPGDHLAFFQSLVPFHETEREIFVHACYEAHLPMDEQSDAVTYWTHLGEAWPQPHCSGKRVFVGHTPQPLGNILDLGYLVCLDTYCFGQGYLTAMNLDSQEITQVDYHGRLRRPPASESLKWLGKKWGAFAEWAFGSRSPSSAES
jgi:serine/threonine protein phosphatase 1